MLQSRQQATVGCDWSLFRSPSQGLGVPPVLGQMEHACTFTLDPGAEGTVPPQILSSADLSLKMATQFSHIS
jgi:hypothetical protein